MRSQVVKLYIYGFFFVTVVIFGYLVRMCFESCFSREIDNCVPHIFFVLLLNLKEDAVGKTGNQVVEREFHNAAANA